MVTSDAAEFKRTTELLRRAATLRRKPVPGNLNPRVELVGWLPSAVMPAADGAALLVIATSAVATFNAKPLFVGVIVD